MSSRFFRSNSSSSSSGSEPATDSDDGAEDEVTETMSSLAAGSGTVKRPSTDFAYNHQEFLLHALLEERCLNEVRASYDNNQRPRPASAEIKAQAKAKYRRMCAQMASYNLISTGLEDDQHAIARQRYRDGLDILSQSNSATTVPQPLRRLLTDLQAPKPLQSHANDDNLSWRNDGHMNQPVLPYPLRRLLTDADGRIEYSYDNNSEQTTPFIGGAGSRYHSEFEEKGLLGRGGYGIVYRVRHRVDNQIYAVKKIPLSSQRIRRLQGTGDPGLEALLNEVRTLARLDHPNIVRYFHCWIEWVTVPPPSGLLTDHSDDQAVAGAADDSELEFFHRVVTESDTYETGIVFEHSDRLSNNSISHGSENAQNISNGSLQHRHAFTTTTDNQTVETIGRSIDPSVSIQSAADGPRFTEPTLALHVQMSLYPMTLADFISPPETSRPDGISSLEHCFHLEPSVNIMLLIVDGIEYLHDEGVVHRDIKPGNIFMGPKRNPRSTRGSVDLLLCSDCRIQHKANLIRLDVKIGDFGLATVVDPDLQVDTSPSSEAVGTEMYRPANAKARSTSLDIYALGIIFFELLRKFNTRSERLHEIQQLKQGGFPHRFAESLGTKRARPVMECIRAMLSQDGDDLSIRELRQMLSAM